jgi:MerR family transcriptional regulator/heat shock protein HspR
MRVERKKQSANGTDERAGTASTPASNDECRPVYYISVVAEMVETHPQTLRMYERMGLVAPCRTRAGVRLYSQADVEQVRRIQHLTQELGVNLAGVEVIFDLLREMQRLQAEMESLATQREQGSTPRPTRSRK